MLGNGFGQRFGNSFGRFLHDFGAFDNHFAVLFGYSFADLLGQCLAQSFRSSFARFAYRFCHGLGSSVNGLSNRIRSLCDFLDLLSSFLDSRCCDFFNLICDCISYCLSGLNRFDYDRRRNISAVSMNSSFFQSRNLNIRLVLKCRNRKQRRFGHGCSLSCVRISLSEPFFCRCCNFFLRECRNRKYWQLRLCGFSRHRFFISINVIKPGELVRRFFGSGRSQFIQRRKCFLSRSLINDRSRLLNLRDLIINQCGIFSRSRCFNRCSFRGSRGNRFIRSRSAFSRPCKLHLRAFAHDLGQSVSEALRNDHFFQFAAADKRILSEELQRGREHNTF